MINRLSAQRSRLLATRGMLVLRLPAPPLQGDGRFGWLLDPGCNVRDDSRWDFDGSLINGSWKSFRSTGFGIVVASTDGELLGCGNGVRPHWCMTAASTEAWALRTVLEVTPFPPKMRTDCLSLLTTARAGKAKATDPRKKLARIWCQIVEILGTNLEQLTQGDTLVWMPAHQSVASVGEVKLSSGHRLTWIDWRANRLVDALAKRAAAEHQPPLAVERILRWAKPAVRHSAKILAAVTHAANHHEVSELGSDGESVKRTVRDSVDAPRQVRHRRRSPQPAAAPETSSPVPKLVQPWRPPARETARRRPSQAPAARAADAANLHRRVQEIGDALRPADRATATDRMQALRARVLQGVQPA